MEGYAEQPLAADWSVVASGRMRLGENVNGASEARAGGEVGLKRSLARSDRGAMAVQAGPAYLDSPDDRCRGWGAETRLLAGRNVGRRAFTNLEVARRFGEGNCGEVAGEATGGVRGEAGEMTLIQAFYHEPSRGDATISLQVSRISPPRARKPRIQLGVRVKSGGISEMELYAIAAVWRTG